jgi:hypothetical protein
MDNTKIEKVKNRQTPFNIREVWKFLGFTGYYRYFIQDYLCITQPLLDLMQKTTPWHWEECQQVAFETLQEKMCNKPVLWQPDFMKPFIILMDTSAYAVGAILLQEGEINPQKPTKKPKSHPIAYYSATFTATERG